MADTAVNTASAARCQRRLHFAPMMAWAGAGRRHAALMIMLHYITAYVGRLTFAGGRCQSACRHDKLSSPTGTFNNNDAHSRERFSAMIIHKSAPCCHFYHHATRAGPRPVSSWPPPFSSASRTALWPTMPMPPPALLRDDYFDVCGMTFSEE